jgi:hypothetical protein
VGNDQPALRALFACGLDLSEPDWLEHAFVLLIWQKKHGTELAKFALGALPPPQAPLYRSNLNISNI